MSKKANPGEEEDATLAAEYVLGVLDAKEHAACSLRAQRDPVFAERVADWEMRLADLNSSFSEIPPPGSVKAALDRRLFPIPEKRPQVSLWDSLGFWRFLSGTAIAAFAVLAFFILQTPRILPPGETLVASLAGSGGAQKFIALYETGTGIVRVSVLSERAPADRDFELWLIKDENPPVSLGIFGRGDIGGYSLSDALKSGFTDGVTLAVSLEPKGGSTTGSPTGPVIAAGTAKKI